jgi:serine protease
VIAATGNEANLSLISPANCTGVIAVAAHTINGENADYSNLGAATALSAPGGGSPVQLPLGDLTDDPNWNGYYIWSTSLFGTTTPFSSNAQGQTGYAYGGLTGTSAATPHVAGAAALIKSIRPAATAAQVRDFLVTTVRPFPAGSACAAGGAFVGLCGAGLLDATAALDRAAQGLPPIIVSAPQSVTVVEGQAASFSVSAAGAPNLTYQWRRNGVDIPGANGSSYTTLALGLAESGTRYSVTVSNPLGTVTSSEAVVTVVAGGGGGGGGGALPLGQLLLLGALLLGARLRRRE